MQIILFLLLALSLGSCKKTDAPSTVEPVLNPLEPIEEVNLIVPEDLYKPVVPQGDSIYNVIGYGYDFTGKHNDASSVRDKVVDIPAYVAGEKPDNFVPWRNTTAWHDSYDALNAVELARLLSDESKVTEGKALYGGTMSELFPKTSAFSAKYVYGYYTQYLQRQSFRFWVDDALIEKFRKYLSSSFQSDVQNLSPEMIIKKYGTHVLAEIVLGAKLDILYQAEVGVDDRSDLQKNGYDAAIKSTFGFWTSRLEDIDSVKLRKVKSPALSFRVAGGDPSKIKVLETAKGQTVDISEWLKTTNTRNVFIQTRSTIPLSLLIVNGEKRNEVQTYIDAYLEHNQVEIVK